MTTRTTFIFANITAALIAGVASAQAQAQAFPEKPDYKFEKCFGVAKAAQNDCTTAQHSCGSLGSVDADPNDWIYTPKGTCQRLVNGKLGPSGS
jgi:uncharacterized membrane protein